MPSLRRIPSVWMALLTAVLFLSVLLLPSRGYAQRGKRSQEDTDSLVRLLSAQSAQLLDVNGESVRKVFGPARFLHNNTYLICDTALWNVNTRIINAFGHVKILQDQTELTSDRLVYRIDDDLAEFRGTLVQLKDKDNNTLRTRFLDFNTKDSVGTFMNGGAMRDKTGQIIESRQGRYDSKEKTFTFTDQVNMFSDSVFVKTSLLVYHSDDNRAEFGYGTDAWQRENMLSADDGWYDRGREVFFFRDKVHLLTDTQEAWSDSLYFYRKSSDVDMLGNVQLTDTTRDVSALAGRIQYRDSLQRIKMTRRPAVVAVTGEGAQRDSVYLGADTLIYYSVPRCDVDTLEFVRAEKRMKDMSVDPVASYRAKAAEAAAEAARAAAENDPNSAEGRRKRAGRAAKAEAAPAEILPEQMPAPLDSAAVAVDSTLAAAPDSLAAAVPKDTTKIGFVQGISRVKLWRSDFQTVCDSLEFNELDSLVRLYRSPVVWNEEDRQYSADSISVVVKDGKMTRANLMSSAFIIIQEDSTHFDQIRAAEMTAHFGDSTRLKRFDAMGGSDAIFFLEENGKLATSNVVNTKMLSAVFTDEGQLHRVYYYEAPKSDAYPLAQMTPDQLQLKGFNWQPSARPLGRADITPLSLRPSRRMAYEARPRATFRQTELYFPGYMKAVYRQIAVSDSLRQVRDRRRAAVRDSLAALPPADSLAPLSAADSMALAALTVADTLAAPTTSQTGPSETTEATASPAAETPVASEKGAAAASGKDAAASKEVARQSKEAERALRRQARAAADSLRRAEKEARWARLDSLDAAKSAAKQAKKEARRARKDSLALDAARRQMEKDAARLEKYRQHYQARKEKRDARAARRDSVAAARAAARDSEQTAEPMPDQAAEAVRDQAARPAAPSTP